MFKTKTKTSWSKTKTKTKNKTFIFVLEALRDEDPGLEDYTIIGIHRTVSYRIVSEYSVHHYIAAAAVAAAAALAGKSRRSGDMYCIDSLTHLYWLPLGSGCRWCAR